MTDDNHPWTSISIRIETRDAIRSLKRGGESYDDLVRRAIGEIDPETLRQLESESSGSEGEAEAGAGC